MHMAAVFRQWDSVDRSTLHTEWPEIFAGNIYIMALCA